MNAPNDNLYKGCWRIGHVLEEYRSTASGMCELKEAEWRIIQIVKDMTGVEVLSEFPEDSGG